MGLALISAVLERAGYAVNLLDANAMRLQPEETAALAEGADVIGLTAMTPTAGAAMSIAKCIKQINPAVPVILGGVHATLLPEETLAKAPAIDIILRGEGEDVLLELLKVIEQKQPLNSVPSISYRQDGNIISTEAATGSIDIDSLPFHAYHLLNLDSYQPGPPHGRAAPFAAIMTSRGCPYRCAYCSKPVFGKNFRAQSAERVLAEIDYLKDNFGIKEFAVYDDVFTLNNKRAMAIAEGIIKKKLDIIWTCESRVNLVDEELLRKMKQAGCYAIAYGIESHPQSRHPNHRLFYDRFPWRNCRDNTKDHRLCQEALR
jgi:radical SAM superfamily enzyme YgiQ (UPF0313 family)